MIRIIILTLLIVLLIGSLPLYPYSRNWGYRPGGVLGVLLIVLIAIALMGYI